MWTRRTILTGLLATGFLTSRPCVSAVKGTASASPLRGACARAGAGSTPPPLLRTTGIAMLDGQLVATHQEVIAAFRLEPGFGILDDDGEPNARAIRDRMQGTLRDGADGTVLLGRELTLDALADDNWGAIVVKAILAHETGHILQFESGLDDRLLLGQRTFRPIELHADFLAGWWLGRAAMEEAVFRDLATESFYAKGDTRFQDPNHHGTPEERAAALLAGFDAAGEVGGDARHAADAGTRYIRSLNG